jgi:hypothetical protein
MNHEVSVAREAVCWFRSGKLYLFSAGNPMFCHRPFPSISLLARTFFALGASICVKGGIVHGSSEPFLENNVSRFQHLNGLDQAANPAAAPQAWADSLYPLQL